MKNAKYIIIVAVLLLIAVIGALLLLQKRQPLDQTAPIATENVGEGFPAPVYPEARVASSQANQIYLESEESMTVIIGWYLRELKEQGWEVTSEPDVTDGENQSIVAEKNGMKATVNVKEENDVSTIAVSVQ